MSNLNMIYYAIKMQVYGEITHVSLCNVPHPIYSRSPSHSSIQILKAPRDFARVLVSAECVPIKVTREALYIDGMCVADAAYAEPGLLYSFACERLADVLCPLCVKRQQTERTCTEWAICHDCERQLDRKRNRLTPAKCGRLPRLPSSKRGKALLNKKAK